MATKTITFARTSNLVIPDNDASVTGVLDLLFGYANPITSVTFNGTAYVLTRADNRTWTETYTFSDSVDTDPITVILTTGNWKPSEMNIHRGIREKLFALRAAYGLTSLAVTYA